MRKRSKYHVLDEKRIAAEILNNAKGVAGYIVKVEQAESREQIFRIAVDFDSQESFTKAEATHLAMLEWMDKKIKHLPATSQQAILSTTEEETMLAELIEKYKRPYIEEGYTKGMSQGIIIGEARGEARCEARGEARGKLYIIKEMLIEKFGFMSASWELALDAQTDAPSLRKYIANSARSILRTMWKRF